MRQRCMAASVAVAMLSLGLSPQTLEHASAQQAPKKSASTQPAALTPQEKEAQKHYRIAQEALKNNDLSTAKEELNAAVELAPKNAILWYNLAQVESKTGDYNLGLEHLQKAENLGLPRTLSSGADELEAKLTYEVKRKAKEDTFHGKILELQEEMKKSASGQCYDGNNGSTPIVGNESYGYGLAPQVNPRTVLIGLNYSYYTYFQNPFQGIRSLYINGTATFDFADLSPDLAVADVMFCQSGKHRWVMTIKSKKPEGFHVVGKRKEFVPPLQGGSGQETETSLSDGDTLELSFSSQDSAQAAANTISELIRMSADVQ